jgi:hypothetical protein
MRDLVKQHYIIPRIGNLRLRAVRPATINERYRDLLEHGSRSKGPLSPLTVDGVHRTLRKALNDAVRVEQLLPSNPVVRATRPKAPGKKHADLWTTEQLRTFLSVAANHRLGASTGWPPTPARVAASSRTCAGPTSTWTPLS